MLPWQPVCQGVLDDFLKLSFHMFPYYEILKFLKVKSELIFEESTSKYPQIPNLSEMSRGFGSYEHLKFRPTRQLKYKFFCYHCVEYFKL